MADPQSIYPEGFVPDMTPTTAMVTPKSDGFVPDNNDLSGFIPDNPEDMQGLREIGAVPKVVLTPAQEKFNNTMLADSGNRPIVGGLATASNAALAGFGPMVSGAENYAFSGANDALANLGVPGFKKNPYSPDEAFTASREAYQNALHTYAQKHPLMAGASNIAGAIPGLEAGLIKGTGELGLFAARPILGRIAGSAVAGTARGVGDAVSAHGDAGDIVKSGALGGTLGGLTAGSFEGLNGTGNIIANKLTNSLAKGVVKRLTPVVAGGAIGAGTAAATGGDIKEGALLGSSVGGVASVLGARGKNSVNDLNSDQQSITLQKIANNIANGDMSKAAEVLRNSDSPTLLGAMGSKSQNIVNQMSPEDFLEMKNTVAKAQSRAIDKANQTRQTYADNLKKAIEQHTGISEEDALKSIGHNRYSEYTDPVATVANQYVKINNGHLDPLTFNMDNHGQLFNKYFPDIEGTFNNSLNQYSSDLQNHNTTLDNINKAYDTSSLTAPLPKKGSGNDVMKGGLFGAMLSPHNPVQGGVTGALSAFDLHNAPEIVSAATPIQSKTFGALADKSPSSIAGMLDKQATKVAAQKAQIATKAANNAKIIPRVSAAVAGAAMPTDAPKPKKSTKPEPVRTRTVVDWSDPLNPKTYSATPAEAEAFFKTHPSGPNAAEMRQISQGIIPDRFKH